MAAAVTLALTVQARRVLRHRRHMALVAVVAIAMATRHRTARVVALASAVRRALLLLPLLMVSGDSRGEQTAPKLRLVMLRAQKRVCSGC